MNIWGLKNKLAKARKGLNFLEEELGKEKKKRNYDQIEFLNRKIKSFKKGMSNIRDEIKELKGVRKKLKTKR